MAEIAEGGGSGRTGIPRIKSLLAFVPSLGTSIPPVTRSNNNSWPRGVSFIGIFAPLLEPTSALRWCWWCYLIAPRGSESVVVPVTELPPFRCEISEAVSSSFLLLEAHTPDIRSWPQKELPSHSLRRAAELDPSLALHWHTQLNPFSSCRMRMDGWSPLSTPPSSLTEFTLSLSACQIRRFV